MREKIKVAVIGANEFQYPLIAKARERGYETHVFAWEDGAVGREIADYFYPISVTEKQQILEACRKIGIQGIASIGSDLVVDTVNTVAAALSLPANAPETTKRCTNKYAMRRALQAAGAPVPGFFCARSEAELSGASTLRFPLIVKPTDRSGSRGITKVSTPEGLSAAFENAVRFSFEKACMVEEFFEGREYSCEGITQNGVHHFLAITKKYTTGSPHFIETGHVEPCDIPPAEWEGIYAMLRRALDALGVTNSAFHAEFRRNAAGALCIMEIGARMGGDCIGSSLVPLATGHDFVGYVWDVALGTPLALKGYPEMRAAAIRFVFEQRDLSVLQKIRAEAPQALAEVRMDAPLGSRDVTDSASRYGYYIIKGSTAAEVCALTALTEKEEVQ